MKFEILSHPTYNPFVSYPTHSFLQSLVQSRLNEMKQVEFGSDFEGISALGVGQDRYLYMVVL